MPFESRNEGVARLGGGKCHRPKCKARDHCTRCSPWRSID
ncbi:hypothetical protein Gogos_018064 [Gossypium gossypioides]|uniref:Uncharacterized protein n=1 Tax=Gossypium gossypioides TaxID=34282 RepID=A0A7J9BEH0_GOSGO|nr:hypothetical protein [Gossypium gossypioides]